MTSSSTKKENVNGIDTDRLLQTITEIRSEPEIAKFTFRAKNVWDDGAHCHTSIKDFHGAGKEDTSRSKPFTFHADEPDVLLGNDQGPNATEALLHALASCLNATLIFQASVRGIRIDELEFDLEGDLDLHGFLGLSDRVRNGYQQVRINCRIKADAKEDELRELVELAQKRSPVFDIVTNPVSVKVNLEKI